MPLIPLFLLALISLIFPSSASAQCPVCIVTVGGGMLLAKKLGIDDLLISIWISGLNTAVSFWLAPKIKIKFLNNPFILSLILLGMTLSYFYITDQIGAATNKILGIDKIVAGQTLGLMFMLLGISIDKITRIKNNGKILFPYQKVVFPVGSLLLFTIIFKFIFNL
jgi:hypothetical protein